MRFLLVAAGARLTADDFAGSWFRRATPPPRTWSSFEEQEARLQRLLGGLNETHGPTLGLELAPSLLQRSAKKVLELEGPGFEGEDEVHKMDGFLSALRLFQDKKWTEDTWYNQQRYLDMLRMNVMQVIEKTELHEQVKVGDMVAKINRKKPEFAEKERRIWKLFKDFTVGWKDMLKDMVSKEKKWSREIRYASMEQGLTKAKNEIFKEKLMNRAIIEIGDMDTELEYFVESWPRLKAPFKEEIQNDIDRYKKRFDRVGAKVEQSQRKFRKSLGKLKSTHKLWADEEGFLADKFEDASGECERVLERIPLLLEAKDAAVLATIKKEMVDRVSAQTTFKQEQVKKNEATEKEIMTLKGVAEKYYKALDEKAKVMTKETSALMKSDIKTYKEDAETELKKVTAEAETKKENLAKRQEAVNAKLQKLLAELRVESEDQTQLSSQADASVSRVTQDRISKYKDVEMDLEKALKTAYKQVQGNLDESTKQTLDTALNEIGGVSLSTERTVAKALKDSTPGVHVAMAYMSTTMYNLVLLKQDIFREIHAAQEVDDDTGKFESAVKADQRALAKTVHGADAEIISKAKAATDTVKRRIEDKQKVVQKIKQDAVKELDKTSREVAGAFEDESDNYDLHLEKAAGVQTAKINQFASATRQSELLLNAEADRIKAGVDRASKTDLPAITASFEKFNNEATVAINGMEDVSAAGIKKAESLVAGHMATAESVRDAALADAGAKVFPLLTAARNHIAKSGDRFDEQLAGLKSTLDTSGKKLDARLSGAEDTNRQAAELLSEKTGQLEMAFTRAKSQSAAFGKALDQERVQTDRELDRSKRDAEDEVLEAKRSLTERAAELEEASKTANAQAVERVTEEETDAERVIAEDVTGVTKAMAADGKKVSAGARTLKAALEEADQKAAQAQETGQAEVQGLQDEQTQQQKQDAKAARAVDERLQNGGETVVATATSQLQAAEQQGEESVGTAAKQAAREAVEARQRVQQSASELQKAMDVLQEVSDEEVSKVGTDVASVKDWMANAAKDDEKRTENLKDAFAKIKREGAAKGQEFEASLKKAGAALAALVGADNEAMRVLITKLEATITYTKDKVNTQGKADEALLHDILMTARADAGKVREQVLSSQRELEEFALRLQEIDSQSALAVDKTKNLRDDIDSDLGHQSRAFVQRLQTERLARENATHTLLSDTLHSVTSIAYVLDGVERLEKKAVATVQYHLGTLDLEDKKAERELMKALELERHTDDGAVEEVIGKLNDAKKLEAQLANWRYGAEGSAKKFQGLVNAEFSDLGHDLDLSKIELAEEAAMEKWAVENQMSELKAHLGSEVHDLSALSQKRLADLAADSARRIALLRADESLTEKERADAIAKIKAESKTHAQRILEDNGRLELDQATAARHLDLAVQDVEDTAARLSDLDSAGSAPGVAHVLDRIHDMLGEARSNLFATEPPVVGEVVPGLLELGQAAARAPAGTAAAIVAEDRDLERMLDAAR